MFEQYIQNHYLRAAILLIGIFIILKLFVFISEKVILRFTKKTKTDIDDILVERLSKPLTLMITLLGLRLAFAELPFSDTVSGILGKSIESIMILITAYIAYIVIDTIVVRGFRKLASRTKSEVDDSLINFFHGAMKVVAVIFVLLYVMALWGIDLGPYLAGLGIAGIAIAFALQSSLSNIFGGISMLLDKTIKVGDTVYLDADTKGEVIQIGLRSTKIKTFDNEVIIVPNGKLADSRIQNIALPEPKVRVVIPFSVAYGSDIDKVKKIVFDELKKIKFLSKDEPVIRFIEMGSSSLNFKAYFFVENYQNRWDSIDEANTRIYNALNKNKIEIPFPQLDVHMKKD